MQIAEIVLYSHDGRTRRLQFALGSLNIITGRKGTGKSALVRIIEYCLGSAENKVPAGVIRDCTAWYGLVLQLKDTRVFVARAEPKPGRRSSSSIYVDLGSSIDVPVFGLLEQNSTADSLIGLLSERLGIASVETQRKPQSLQVPYQITISHALFFNFQRQDEIAKPTLLFHRQDEPYVDAHIRDVLPYFLGAMSEDRLLQVQQLRLEKAELRALERSLDVSEPLTLDDPRALSLVEEARAVGLLPRSTPSAPNAIDLLSGIDVDAEPILDIEGLEEVLDRRRRERDELLAQHRVARRRIEMLRALAHEEVDYNGELDSQKARLISVGLVPLEGVHKCPLCEQPVTEQLPSLGAVREAIKRLDEQLAGVVASRPRVEAAIGAWEERAAKLRQELQLNQATLHRVADQAEKLRKYRDEFAASGRVRGRIQFYLESLRPGESEATGLRSKIDGLTRSITDLETELSLENVDERLEYILRIVGDDMTRWASDLDLEYRNHVRLDPKKLTVYADTDRGPVPLERMGSGANWLGYHLITYAALHKWFEAYSRPVPRFVFFDQPTQVFYPPDADDAYAFPDDDRARVTRLFSFLAKLPSELGHQVQIIVTDHAVLDLPEFQSAIRANWHNAEALIPSDWPRQVEADSSSTGEEV
jgi:hypothetical protein